MAAELQGAVAQLGVGAALARELDEALPLVGAGDYAVRSSMAERRLVLTLVGAFAAAALLLAMLGV